MREERIKFTPVILDPNTASNCLYLSEDLTSVRNKTTAQDVPDNPERFMVSTLKFWALRASSQGNTVGRWSEMYTNGSGKLLTLKKIPQRIRVVLDCDRGEVSFYNPEGNDHIYTYEATFSEKIYPYF
ncbi:hypothetical protein CRUP_008830, partial [Coryphaenoides rupestris]